MNEVYGEGEGIMYQVGWLLEEKEIKWGKSQASYCQCEGEIFVWTLPVARKKSFPWADRHLHLDQWMYVNYLGCLHPVVYLFTGLEGLHQATTTQQTIHFKKDNLSLQYLSLMLFWLSLNHTKKSPSPSAGKKIRPTYTRYSVQIGVNFAERM